jgi:hypothetical protein
MLRGEMTITVMLTAMDGGNAENGGNNFLSEINGRTRLEAVHDGLPPGLSPADNETGWRMALDKLAALVEFG